MLLFVVEMCVNWFLDQCYTWRSTLVTQFIVFRALAKRTAKETSKEVVKEAEKKYVTNGKQQEH